MKGRARGAVLVSVIACVLTFPHLAAANGGLTPVLVTKEVELVPFSASGWFGWSQLNERGRPVLMIRPDGGSPFVVNPSGTAGVSGSVVGNQLTYDQQTGNQRSEAWDIVFYDLESRTHVAAPAGINTKLREDVSSSSGEWLLFRRSKTFLTNPQEIILANLKTGEQRVIGRGDGGGHYAQPGRVEGDYATWYRCHGLDRCDVYRYRISTGTTDRMPNPNKRAQFAASVTPDGTVYFIEGTLNVCGKHVALWRVTPSGARERLAALELPADGLSTFPVTSGRTTTVYLDVVVCTHHLPDSAQEGGFDSDIYSVTL